MGDEHEVRIQQLEARILRLEQRVELHSRVISGEYPTGVPALVERFESIAKRLDDIQSGIMTGVGRLENHRQRAVWVLVLYGLSILAMILALTVIGVQAGG